MDIKAQLLAELSRANVNYMVHVLGNDPACFKELINIIISGADPLPMRASWVIEGITSENPSIIIPYSGLLIKNLRKFRHQGTRRNILKIFSGMQIDKKHHGLLLDICFEWLGKEERTVAEKVYSMQIIANHIPSYPELANEFFEILDDQLPKNSPGFSARTRLVKKQLKFTGKS